MLTSIVFLYYQLLCFGLTVSFIGCFSNGLLPVTCAIFIHSYFPFVNNHYCMYFLAFTFNVMYGLPSPPPPPLSLPLPSPQEQCACYWSTPEESVMQCGAFLTETEQVYEHVPSVTIRDISFTTPR